jgi:predicted kinase
MKLILMVGLPRSGKSTWALEQGVPVVAGDAIRLALFGKRWWGPGEHQVMATARTMVRSLFFAGHTTVIFDSTNVTIASRRFWLPTSDCMWDLKYKVVGENPKVCISRAIKSDQAYLVPVIEKAVKEWQQPGFDKEFLKYGTKDSWNEWDFFKGSD